jgi:CHASE2 domain-containing sensor protein
METEERLNERTAAKARFFNFDHVMVCVFVFIFAAILLLLSVNLSIFNPLRRALDDFSMTDIYYQILNDESARELNDKIVLVDMTKQYRREDIAKTISDVSHCKPKVMMVDVIFERITDNDMGNAALVASLEKAPNTVLACKLYNYDENANAFKNCLYSFFESMGHYDWAFSNVISKFNYGTIREYSISQNLNGKRIYSMPYMTACRYFGTKPQKESVNNRYIVYSNTDFPVVSCDSILANRNLLKDRIVMIGTLQEEADMHLTPVGKMPGMKILAYSALSYIDHRNIQTIDLWKSILLLFVVCYISAFIGFRIIHRFPETNSLLLNIYYFCMAALLVWVGFISFVKFDYEINLLYPLLGLALVEPARMHYKWIIRIMKTKTKWGFPTKSIYYD